MLTRAFLSAILVLCAGGAAVAGDRVEGDWLLPDGASKVTIAPCRAAPERICGAVSWLKKPEDAGKQDPRNPDPRLRDRPLLGLPVLWDFTRTGPGRWTGGRIYDPRDGRTYRSRLMVLSPGALKVEGCVLMICQAQTWTR